MLKFSNMQDSRVSKNKTKICFVITKGNWGGAQKYLFTLATSLPKDKYDVLAIVGVGEILKKKIEKEGIRVYEIKDLKRNISIFAEIISFIKIFKIVSKESPDVLHLNSPKASGIGAVVGRILLTPKIIQTVHGFTFNEHRSIFAKFLIYIFSYITVVLCTKTIVIAKNEKKQAESMPFISRKKITLIRNGIEKIDFIDRSIVRRALLERVPHTGLPLPDVNGKEIWIGTISELNKNKGHKYMIEALSNIKEPFIFFIIGDGVERKNIEDLVIQKGLEKKVYMLGFIDIANLYLKAFDIFTLTSLKEGLPYTLLEAGLAGNAIISTDIGGIPDIVDDGKNGLLNKKKDVKEIQKDIEYLIANPDVRKEFGKKIKEKVEKEFSVDGMLKKTFSLYK